MTNEDIVLEIQNGRDSEGQLLYDLWNRNKGLIYKAVKRYEGRMEIDDLMQESYFAVVKAAESYDPEQGQTFAGYLFTHVRSHVGRYVANMSGTVRLPQNVQFLVWRYNRAQAAYFSEYGENMPDVVAMRELRISKKQLKNLKSVLEAAKTPKSIETTIREEEGAETLRELLPDGRDTSGEVISKIFRMERAQVVREALEDLPEKYAEVLKLRHYHGKAWDDICRELNVSIGVARQREAQGRFYLRRTLRKKLESFYDESATFSRGTARTGAGVFRITGTSATERAALCEIEKAAGRVPLSSADPAPGAGRPQAGSGRRAGSGRCRNPSAAADPL